jgi:hypothetical protein
VDPTEKGYYWCNATDEMGEPPQIVAVLSNKQVPGEFYVQKIGFEMNFSVMDFANWKGPLKVPGKKEGGA